MSVFAIFGLSTFFLFVGAASFIVSEKCEPETSLDERNRDGVKPLFPLKEDPRFETSNIVKAHEILRNALRQFFNNLVEEDLGFYLNHIIDEKPTFKDEYDQDIDSYFKVFESIWQQYNETLCRNYATNQFKNDKLDLCSVARFLSHQTAVKDRETITKRMGDALSYKCQLCTPYKRKEFGQYIAPNIEQTSPEGMSLEERLVLCKDYDHYGKFIGLLSNEPSNTSSASSASSTSSEAPAPEDFSPCYETLGYVECDQISLQEIRRVFYQTSLPTLDSVELILQPYIFSETFIPEDVFGTHKIYNIRVEFPSELVVNRSLSLQVDVNAFRSTKTYTRGFEINNIDCTLLDLGFLTGFDQLTGLQFSNIGKIQHCLPSLPPLPLLDYLVFVNCSDMNQLLSYPTLKNGLRLTQFINNDGSTVETVDRLMDWLLISSANTLVRMEIVNMKQVTRVPHKMPLFKALTVLRLAGNNISTIKCGELSFSVPVSLLDLFNNGIKEIEPGAFQGDFKDAYVSVHNNKLTRYEESVFGTMLQQMASGNGIVNPYSGSGNPIDCSEETICHMNWLRRYKNVPGKEWFRNLVKCSTGTFFHNLPQAAFNNCQPITPIFEAASAVVSGPKDFSPCYSYIDSRVYCSQISLEEVRRVFNQTSSPTLVFVELILQPDLFISERFIPEDIFGVKQIQGITIEYPFELFVNRSPSLQVDPNAFRSSKNYTEIFRIGRIDCTLLDLGFLSGFDELSSLQFSNVNNIEHCLPRLPPLPKLTSLDFRFCTGMNHPNIFPSLRSGLKDFTYSDKYNNDTMYNDETVDRIVDWLLLSSENTLEEMKIEYMKQMTQVPLNIPSFKALRKVALPYNKISTIKSGAFSFSVPVSLLDISNNGIHKIEPGAFQGKHDNAIHTAKESLIVSVKFYVRISGDFKDAKVDVSHNYLTHFVESVFEPILQQMTSGKGLVNAYGNPIDCSEESICRLAWLRRYKANFNFNFKCSNGTSFQNLRPAGFNHCPY